jgi:hypothetical protein
MIDIRTFDRAMRQLDTTRRCSILSYVEMAIGVFLSRTGLRNELFITDPYSFDKAEYQEF